MSNNILLRKKHQMEIKIRRANIDEIAILLEFEKGIIAAERPFDETLKEGDIHYYDLAELINAPDAEVVLAIADDKPVGSGYAKILKALPYLKHEYYANLGFMYVKPEYRGKGINRLILNALLSWAKSKDITEVRLEVYDDNQIAKKAYSKAGFKGNLLEMRMEI